ncbi:MAG TPA: hypothetical protein VHZ24_22890, partial [Pirellulales bacterium]|nr:hypothetical protein [Pirellulales bacterium]
GGRLTIKSMPSHWRAERPTSTAPAFAFAKVGFVSQQSKKATDHRLDKIAGAILGTAVGDALA